MTASPSPQDGVGFRSARGPVLIGLMLSMGLVSLDSTILATAVPSIVAGLGGVTKFPWLFSIYLLAQAVTVPVYGKLADQFGRKPVILFGIVLFLIGSMLSGIAWNMTALILFRLLQGIGAGAVQPMMLTIVGDLYSLTERPKVQAYTGSVYAVSAVLGPALGGVFSEYVSWRWIFYVNVPLCLLSAAMIARHYHEHIERRRPKIDYPGAVLLTGGLTLVVLGVLEGGQSWGWVSVPSVSVFAVGLVLLIAFGLVEPRAAEPILPLGVLRDRLVLSTSLAAAALGANLIGLSSYIPAYLQDVLGTGPLVAGFTLAALTLAWPVTASQSGRLYLRFGFRTASIVGSCAAVVATAFLLLLGRDSSVGTVAGVCFGIGLGMGLVSSTTVIAAQMYVQWNERGVVTGTNMFFRAMGSAVGVAVFGAIANRTVRTSTGGHVDPGALAVAVHHIFIATLVVAALMLVVSWAMPRQPLGQQRTDTGEQAVATAIAEQA